jgi:N-acetylmuramic acid 6-phosphate etherase
MTEQRNPRSMDLHRLDVAQVAGLINREDEAVVVAVRRALPALVGFIEACAARFDAGGAGGAGGVGGRLIYLGAGTSGRLGVLDASEAPPTFQVEPGRIVGLIAGGDAALRTSSEGKEDDPEGAADELKRLRLSDRDSVLAIAAGGTTPYAVGALAVAKRLAPGCVTGLLTCAPVKRPAACEHLIVLETGPEVLTGSTRMKAGTATKLALNTISTALMVQAGRVHENLMVDLRASNAKLRDRAGRIVAALTGLEREAALKALDRAGGAAKTAVVMVKLGLTRREAELRLAGVKGRLGRALG